MSRDPQLPEGVPADNKPEAAFAAGPETSSDFSAPETATPRFEEPDRSPPPLSSKAAAASRADLMSRQHQNLTLLIAVVALAMAIGGVLLLRSPKAEVLPLCSAQPEWNQYNCRAD